MFFLTLSTTIMQFGFGMGPDTSWMREELTQLGVEELITPVDVDRAMKEYKGTMLLAINSVWMCCRKRTPRLRHRFGAVGS